MKSCKLLLILYLLKVCCCQGPISIGVFGLAAIVYKVSEYEFCWDTWTKHNVTMLENALDNHLFGQHLVNKVVSKAVRQHLESENPRKALVLSFHGWTGSGKNYVTDIIANHVFRQGTKSKFLLKRISTLHYPHASQVDKYKDELKTFIETKIQACSRSMFVFDEVDKMPSGLTDVIKAFLDYHTDVEGVDYRKSIFIFLSNTGGNEIIDETLKQFEEGLPREDITTERMERILSTTSFNADSGLRKSELIYAGLVDFFVPFLPLERKHVRQCAEAAIQRTYGRKAKPTEVNCVANELQYFPHQSKIFSKTGCKQVEKKAILCSDEPSK